jgi:organic hydroperoxide reductase OsmC/OhrA
MAREHHYAAHLVWTGGAQGPTKDYASYSREHVVRIEGKPDLVGSADPHFRGDPERHNPEDWLVAALSACHMLTYLAICARKGIAVVSYEDAASGTMALEGGGGHFTEVVLRPRVTLAAGSDARAAEALHEDAHKYCFIAASVNFPVRHEAETMVSPSPGTGEGGERKRAG